MKKIIIILALILCVCSVEYAWADKQAVYSAHSYKTNFQGKSANDIRSELGWGARIDSNYIGNRSYETWTYTYDGFNRTYYIILQMENDICTSCSYY